MYIIAIGWLYVTFLMAFTEAGIVAGILSFVFYGLLPSGLLLWLFRGSKRGRRSATVTGDDFAGKPDRGDTQTDQ